MAQAEQQVISESDNSKQQNLISQLVKNSIFLLVALLCLFAFFIVRQAIEQAPSAKVEVRSEGLNKVQFSQLNKAMQAQEIGTFFSTDLQSVREQARSFSWVDEVNITRNWKQGIVVEALPKQPIARFGSEKLIDAKGQVYEPADVEPLVASDLVMLQGNPKQSEAIMQQMQQINTWYEPLGLAVEDIILTPRMTWLVRFDSGLRLLVDGENTSQKLLNVSQILQKQLAGERDNIESIDLRYKNGFAIAWKPNSAASSDNKPKSKQKTTDS